MLSLHHMPHGVRSDIAAHAPIRVCGTDPDAPQIITVRQPSPAQLAAAALIALSDADQREAMRCVRADRDEWSRWQRAVTEVCKEH